MSEVIGDAPDRRVELLCDHDAVHATWTRFGPGRDGAAVELRYVLDGAVRLGDRACAAGTWMELRADESLRGAARLLKLSVR